MDIRLILPNGEQHGIIPYDIASSKAAEVGLDLVLLSDRSEPHVYKIMDKGKFEYDKKKKEKQIKKNQAIITTKEVRLRPVTDTHDLGIKAKQIHKFINSGDKVRIVMKFKGRENNAKEIGFEKLQELFSMLENITIEKSPEYTGNQLVSIIKKGSDD